MIAKLTVLCGLAIAIAVVFFLPVEAAMRSLVAKGKTTLHSTGKNVLSVLDRASGYTWINSKPLRSSELKGKVVLVEFWTYSCINWRRTLPNVRAWSEKYKDKGLVVIGIHTPEFSFERDVDNVKWAASDMNIAFPVVIDNEFELWNGFSNQYWPAMYFIDGKGHVRHTEFGEGNYDQSERIIQMLLKESGFDNISDENVPVTPTGAEVQADWANLKSNENYLGYGRTVNFASGSIMKGRPFYYHIPKALRLNQWSLEGDWTIGEQSIATNEVKGKLRYRFHARDLHIVMGGKNKDSVRFRVLIDGKPPGSSHGTDIDNDGNGIIGQTRMYQLIRQQGPVTEHEFEIEFIDPGAEAFSVTFG